jgi:protease IV
MKRFLITFIAVIAAQLFLTFAALFVATMIGVAVMGAGERETPVATGTTLVQEIPAELLDYDASPRLPIPYRPATHTAILENLEKARVDARIARVVLKFDVPGGGWGKLQELRSRVQALRAAGKPVYAYTSFGANSTLYLAVACDSIIVAPEGMLWLTGLMAERYYLKDLFEKLGVDVQMARIKEYKAAAEMFTRSDMSPEARENAQWVLADLYEDFCATLARDRGVDRATVEGWLERAPIDPAGARAAGLIDDVLYWEEFTARLKGSADKFVSISGDDYAAVPRERVGLRGRKVAVVHGQGLITTGKSSALFPMETSMGDETMIEALEAAARDKDIDGILLRLDTPGGLGLASDRIGEAVARAAAAKPLVISTIDVNASGGYMVSYRCSPIVALPGSIVGSIGMFSARPSVAGLMDKIGVGWDRVTIGPHATLFSIVTPLSDDEFAQLNDVQWRSYNRWIEGIAQRRGMTVEQVDGLGRGRVFTGRQALANGLIDAVGSFDDALGLLKEKLGIAAGDPVTFMHYPLRRSLLEELKAGDWIAAAQLIAARLGLRSEEEQRIAATLELARGWVRAQEPLLLCPWRFR